MLNFCHHQFQQFLFEDIWKKTMLKVIQNHYSINPINYFIIFFFYYEICYYNFIIDYYYYSCFKIDSLQPWNNGEKKRFYQI